MMKRFLGFVLIALLIVTVVLGSIRIMSNYKEKAEAREIVKKRNEAIEQVLVDRRNELLVGDELVDPFGEDGKVKILLIGVDSRVGQNEGHCDAIQFVTIDKDKDTVDITAVPRGTYSPLPPGTGVTSSDYYVSNSCGLGGLAYGVNQIERIVGQQADYLVVVGFSETLGILRSLKLPAGDTLQWLRQRQGYAIGEPQRARNHSTFLKQQLVRFSSSETSIIDIALQRILYGLVKTDLSFSQVRILVDTLGSIDVSNHPERIRLSMKPAYDVQDIPYDSDNVSGDVKKILNPIISQLSNINYLGVDEVTAQKKLLDLILKNIDDPDFVFWMFEHKLWLQIEDDEERLATQYDIILNYSNSIVDAEEYKKIIGDYIVEMHDRGEIVWEEKGKNLLIDFLGV